MNKNVRTLLITVIVFVVVIVAATYLYNKMQQKVSLDDYAQQLSMRSPAGAIEPEVNEENLEDSEQFFMPDIPFYTLDGEETSFESIRNGRAVVINYFASWCPPCRDEMPYYVEAAQRVKDDVAFIFLDALDGERETLEKVKSFAKEFGMDESMIYYDDGLFAYIFQTNSLPTTVFIDKEGEVVSGYLGARSEEMFLAYLELLM
ncbi:MAG: TlpA disulfide reductase family protein [Sphaerochaetaceae bacterium]|jgi:thiol-disulfide isomerase/thioredoxin